MPKSIEEHFKNKSVKPLYDTLIERIKAQIDSNIFEKPTQYYINIFTRQGGKGFLGISTTKQWLILSARAKLNNSRFQPWTSVTAWGPVGEGGQVKVQRSEDIDADLLSWIKQAYDKANM
jgi:hypothetical protein